MLTRVRYDRVAALSQPARGGLSARSERTQQSSEASAEYELNPLTLTVGTSVPDAVVESAGWVVFDVIVNLHNVTFACGAARYLLSTTC
jgi:hypothetical protein